MAKEFVYYNTCLCGITRQVTYGIGEEYNKTYLNISCMECSRAIKIKSIKELSIVDIEIILKDINIDEKGDIIKDIKEISEDG